MTYSFFDNGSCASDANTTRDTETLAGGVVPNSTTQGPLGTGSYSFQATYSGDANYGASPPSSCEPFSVGLATATTSTSVFDAGTNTAWAGTETAGARAYDTAIVTGVPGITPTGTVTYSFFDNGSCASDANTTTDTETLAGGVVPNRPRRVPSEPGATRSRPPTAAMPTTAPRCPARANRSRWDKASSHRRPRRLRRWDEHVVGRNGDSRCPAYDTASVTGVPGITPTGTVTYSFFDNGSCASDANTTTDTVTLAGGVVPNSTTQGPLAARSYSFQATYHGDANYGASPPSSCEPFSVDKASSSATTIVFDAGSNEPWNGTEVTQSSAYDTSTVTGVAGITPGGTLTYTYFTNATCSGSGSPAGTVTLAGNGSVPHSSTEGPLTPQTYSFDATYNGDGNYSASPVSTCEEFTVAQGTASPPSIINIPQSAVYGGSFAAAVSTTGNGPKSVTSSTPGFCTVGSDGLTVNYVGAGTCTVTAHVAGTMNYAGATGQPQSFTVARATPSSPVVDNVPGVATEFQSFVAAVLTSGDGIGAVTSSTGGVCTVGADGLTVTFVGFGTCTLTPSVGQGANYLGRTGAPQTFTVNPAARGYWLVGSDGGIFSFGAAAFHGSMGGIPLQRPVVGITPTASRNGYWLVASDGGIFAFGDSAYYGSIPGIGLHPAGSGQPDSLDAPIVGVVPSTSGHGYFMVASDGGVFSFGDAQLRGLLPRNRWLRRRRCRGHARQHGQWLLARDQPRCRLCVRRRRQLRRAATSVGARRRRRGHARRARLLGALRQRSRVRVRRRGRHGRSGRVCQLVQPGRSHLPHRGRKGLLGGCRPRRRLLLRRRPLHGQHGGDRPERQDHRRLRVLGGQAPSASSSGAGSSATTARTTDSTPRPSPAEALRSRSER